MGRGKAGGAAVAAGKKASEAGTKSRKAAEEKGAGVTGESKAGVIIGHEHMDKSDKDAIRSAIRGVLGPGLKDKDLANIVGAPDNAKVSVSGTGAVIYLDVDSSQVRLNRSIYREDDGKVVVRNDLFQLKGGVPQGTGIGTKVFARQVEQAARLGVDRIETTAARSAYYNGYYTWARLGYDAPLPIQIKHILPGHLAGETRVSGLMKTEQGREFWKTHGDTIDMTFDLKPGSLSRRTLAAYLKHKGVK